MKPARYRVYRFDSDGSATAAPGAVTIFNGIGSTVDGEGGVEVTPYGGCTPGVRDVAAGGFAG